uniref:Uncharacterized protein n=1 Tax=Romanomermis culicivorax TaxID=13658 RepID=A0A915J8F2_ROMCU
MFGFASSTYSVLATISVLEFSPINIDYGSSKPLSLCSLTHYSNLYFAAYPAIAKLLVNSGKIANRIESNSGISICKQRIETEVSINYITEQKSAIISTQYGKNVSTRGGLGNVMMSPVANQAENQKHHLQIIDAWSISNDIDGNNFHFLPQLDDRLSNSAVGSILNHDIVGSQVNVIE